MVQKGVITHEEGIRATIVAGANVVQEGMKTHKEAKEGAFSEKLKYQGIDAATLSSALDIDEEEAQGKLDGETKSLAYDILLKSPDKTIKIVEPLAEAVANTLGNQDTKEALAKLLKQGMRCALSSAIAVGTLGATMSGAAASCVQMLGAIASYSYTWMDTRSRARRVSEEPDDPSFVNDMLFTQAYVKSLQDLPGGDVVHKFNPITVQTLQQTVCAVQTIEKYQKTTRNDLKSTRAEWVAAQKHAVAFTHKLREMLNQAVNMETLSMLPKLPKIVAANVAATLVKQDHDVEGEGGAGARDGAGAEQEE